MKPTTIYFKVLALLVVLTLAFTFVPVTAKANDTTANLFDFYYTQLIPEQQLVYEQLYFETYEDDPDAAYAIVSADLTEITVLDVEKSLEAYFMDYGYLQYFYNLSELTIHDMSAYYDDSILIRVPLVNESSNTDFLDVFSSYLQFSSELFAYYSDDLYEAIKNVVLTTVELVQAEIVDKSAMATMLETALEWMNLPSITVQTNDADVEMSPVIFVFYENEWYCIDIMNESVADHEDGTIKRFLLGEAEAPKVESSAYDYPKLAATRYLHTYTVVEYSLEKRACEENETCQAVNLYHLYFFNNFNDPTSHWNVRINSSGQLVEFSSVHEMYVPLLDHPDYTVSTIACYGETRDVISGYNGPILLRTMTEWFHQEYVTDLTAYVHNTATLVTGYKYTKTMVE